MRYLALLLGLVGLVAGCGVLAPVPQPVAHFDLELPGQSYGERRERVPLVVAVEVNSPSWLRSRAMAYRLLYQVESRRQLYRESRWSAEPAEMVALALERALVGGSAPGGCRLRVELDELIQVFEGPELSHALLVARAGLRPAGTAAVSPPQWLDLVIREPAISPDAVGGVAAQRAALNRLIEEIRAWLAVAPACRAN